MSSETSLETYGKKFKRLPTIIKPLVYVLFLKPNLKELTFEGHERIFVQVEEETCDIILNCLHLEISTVEITCGIEIIKPIEINLLADEEVAVIKLSNVLPVGMSTLEIHFKGSINDEMKGLFRIRNISTPNQEPIYSAITHFEPTDARRVFPCWDEPALKAIFDVTLAVPRDYVALSNMPEMSRFPDPKDPEWEIARFASTPLMSTYLLAIVIGQFDYLSATAAKRVSVRVFTPPGKAEHGRFAIEVVQRAIAYYYLYFEIDYPLPKLDLVAVSDFMLCGMENWGLVVFKEQALMIDPQECSNFRKQYTTSIIVHEVAHQWFGNLVTMEWWTDLWLNEGYANFSQFLCVDYLFPEYNVWSQFVQDCHVSALELDCSDSSHPVEVPISDPSEINEVFDAISYNKGASIIRMLYNYLGEEDFQKGMHFYLKQHKYANTHTDDLWAALAIVSKKPVQKIMSTWTKQKGFPVVTVDVSQKDTKQIYNLRQEKFQSDLKKGACFLLTMLGYP